MTEPETPRGRVMIVDDTAANLKLLDEMLRRQGYEVASFPRGRLALAAAEREPPEIILLDVNMPEMNGYEVCERLKASPELRVIPVIFLSALNGTEDKLKGFGSGAVDYIAKPFQMEEVLARVATHLDLRRAQQAERELLENTLLGVVGTMWELIQLASPALAARSAAIRDMVLRMARTGAPEDRWQYELAGTLCLIGCLTLPDDVFERALAGQPLSSEEANMFRGHPERGARLLAPIPRMGVVAEMIRRQGEAPGRQQAGAHDPATEGAQMLQLALTFNQRICHGVPTLSALSELSAHGAYGGHLLEALRTYSPGGRDFELRTVLLRELRSGMILEEDIFGANGTMLMLKAGTVLTDIWIERLENLAKRSGNESVRVRMAKE